MLLIDSQRKQVEKALIVLDADVSRTASYEITLAHLSISLSVRH